MAPLPSPSVRFLSRPPLPWWAWARRRCAIASGAATAAGGKGKQGAVSSSAHTIDIWRAPLDNGDQNGHSHGRSRTHNARNKAKKIHESIAKVTRMTKKLSALAAGLISLLIIESAAADTRITTFADFKLDALYASWASGKVVSTPTNYQIAASGYGSGYGQISPPIDASGATSVELTVTISIPPGATVGPIVSLVDADGTFVDFHFYNQGPGTHVLRTRLSDGKVKNPGSVPGLGLDTLSFFHLQCDPGGYSGPYTLTFEKLQLIGSAPGQEMHHLARLPGRKMLMAFYLPWFQARGVYSDHWGFHWTMGGHFNPDVKDGSGRRQIASHHYPLIGPYDSLDPAVLEYHVLLMKLAGIDGVIVDWYGSSDTADYGINNRRALAMLEWARKAGLKYALCYEDSTVRNNANPVAAAQQSVSYAASHFFASPEYIQLDSQPLLLDFGPQFFHKGSDWASIFSVLSASDRPALFTEDNCLTVGMGGFDWPPMFLTGGGDNELGQSQLEDYLSAFERKGSSWPSFISTAFSRFNDVYSEAGGKSYGRLDDRGGRTLAETLSRAMTNDSIFVQIATWNDFGEGTEIEPTLEYGYRDLGIIQDLRRQYLDSQFACHTNDLDLATRLYSLRQKYGSGSPIAAELDGIFTDAVSGRLREADSRLKSIEANEK